MQTQKMKDDEVMLLPVPRELLNEVGIGPFDVIQYYITKGKIIIEAIRDPELLREVYGAEAEAETNCCSRCSFREDGR